MKKSIWQIKIDFRYYVNRRGSKYTLNGEKFLNRGEFAEIVAKSACNEPLVKDNAKYDKASDIESLKASVKSSGFTLVNAKLGNTLTESINRYFETTVSTVWVYTVIIDDTAELYWMNREEFKEFLETFCYMNERGFVRCRKTSGKMIAWLEGKCPQPLEEKENFCYNIITENVTEELHMNKEQMLNDVIHMYGFEARETIDFARAMESSIISDDLLNMVYNTLKARFTPWVEEE